ncbi:MAG: N(4)-(beta-N-acetylglucosaminyl)-L-asparaginase [Phycisphaeraceae bacterium]|nr:N(4)-(beta-N-acetylglucosaminyl)-L-asparaginase [Phycisphaeraceae bacterium]
MSDPFRVHAGSETVSPEEADAIGRAHRGPCVVASGNGAQAVERAMAEMVAGRAPVEAVVQGVRLVEDDPTDVSVGYGGLPNALGQVECDACVMDGPTHAVGAVAALHNIRHASSVALEVLRWGAHDLLVGEGALAFARSRGFSQEDLLTPEARQAWERWKAQRDGPVPLSDEDRWELGDSHGAGVPHTTGTVHCAALDSKGRLGAATTTSGLSWKHPGRVGDSCVPGAGIFVDDGVGAAGATGRGESALENCAAYTVVRAMEAGRSPGDACAQAIERMVARTRRPALLDGHGRPNFNVTLYALRADGAFGSASIWSGYRFAVCMAERARLLPTRWLLERRPR